MENNSLFVIKSQTSQCDSTHWNTQESQHEQLCYSHSQDQRCALFDKYLKSCFVLKKVLYFLSNISRQRRSLLAQIRLGILPIKIETGRFRSLPVEQRLCELCEMHKVENEMHFLCECPLYHDFRETLYDHAKLITNDFVTMGMQEKFVYLMKHMWREVSCYLVQSWNIRKDKLYNT